MKKAYEKPFSSVVQLATENIIAASEVMVVMGTELNMDVVDGTVEFGGWE